MLANHSISVINDRTVCPYFWFTENGGSSGIIHILINPQNSKPPDLNIQQLGIVPRYRDPQLPSAWTLLYIVKFKSQLISVWEM